MDENRLKRFGQLIYIMNSKIDDFTSTELSDVNLTREQLYMMEIIAVEDNMTQKKLIYRLNKEQTAVSRAIKKLVDNGYVYKEQSIYDLRSTVLKVTGPGKEVLEKAEDIKAKVVHNFMKELSNDEAQELMILLEKIYDSFVIRDPFRF